MKCSGYSGCFLRMQEGEATGGRRVEKRKKTTERIAFRGIVG